MRKPDLSKLSLSSSSSATAMIVPQGTQIQVDAQGQVSIRTPGNLVLQCSGAFAVLESVSGSIRIEPGAQVEAVTVRCADTCFVQGRLVAWKLVARALHVDEDAEAAVVMQETEKLDVSRNGRVVGNFRSEQELFSLFSRFAPNLRAMPLPDGHASLRLERDEDAVEAEVAAVAEPEPPATAPAPASPEAIDAAIFVDAEATLPDALFLALLLLEGELSSESWKAAPRRVLAELVRLLRHSDLETLRHTHKTLFGRLSEGGEAIRRAQRSVAAYFEAERDPHTAAATRD